MSDYRQEGTGKVITEQQLLRLAAESGLSVEEIVQGNNLKLITEDSGNTTGAATTTANVVPANQMADTDLTLENGSLESLEGRASGTIAPNSFFIENPNVVNTWEAMDDTSVIKELCKLKGIGPWSAEMFLMFCLLRPDVLPLGDLGLRRAVGKNYLNTFDPTYEEVEKFAKKWIPYRSAATWFLWKSIDPIAVAY